MSEEKTLPEEDEPTTPTAESLRLLRKLEELERRLAIQSAATRIVRSSLVELEDRSHHRR